MMRMRKINAYFVRNSRDIKNFDTFASWILLTYIFRYADAFANNFASSRDFSPEILCQRKEERN